MATITAPNLTVHSFGDVLDSLSNLELTVVLDGGSCSVTVRAPGSCEWQAAMVDLDGVWLDDPCAPGYLADLRGWQIARPY